MREHLGVDVDALDEDLMAHEPVLPEHEQEPWYPEGDQLYGQAEDVTQVSKHDGSTVGSGAKEGLDGVKPGMFCLSPHH
jgi:hypothetical protein